MTITCAKTKIELARFDDWRFVFLFTSAGKATDLSEYEAFKFAIFQNEKTEIVNFSTPDDEITVDAKAGKVTIIVGSTYTDLDPNQTYTFTFKYVDADGLKHSAAVDYRF